MLNLGEYKKTLSLATPVIAAQAGQMITGIIDNIMVGQIGALPLAASAFSYNIHNILFVFGIGFSYGLTPLIGNANGSKDQGKIAQLFTHSLFINTLLSVLLVGIQILTATFLFDKMGQTEAVIQASRPFFNYLIWSTIPVVVYFSFKQFHEGLEITKYALYTTIFSNLINIILNYLLIYGKFGFPEMGLEGAGLATFIARGLQLIGIIFLTLRHINFKPYLQKMTFQIRQNISKELFNISIPTAFQTLIEISAFTVGAIMMGWISEKSLAAHQIAISLVALTYMMANGLAAATTIRVSNQLGKHNYLGMKRISEGSFIIAILFMSFTALTFILFRRPLAELYVDDTETIALASKMLVIGAMFQISDGLQVVALGTLRGLREVRIPTMITFIAYWVLALPMGYVLAFHFNFKENGIWLGFLIGLTIAAITLFSLFKVIINRLIKNHP